MLTEHQKLAHLEAIIWEAISIIRRLREKGPVDVLEFDREFHKALIHLRKEGFFEAIFFFNGSQAKLHCLCSDQGMRAYVLFLDRTWEDTLLKMDKSWES